VEGVVEWAVGLVDDGGVGGWNRCRGTEVHCLGECDSLQAESRSTLRGFMYLGHGSVGFEARVMRRGSGGEEIEGTALGGPQVCKIFQMDNFK
jgi:hypothetical protein